MVTRLSALYLQPMKHLSRIKRAALAAVFLACAAFASRGYAVPVTGAINFAGNVNLNNSSAGNSTMVTGWHGLGTGGNPQVQGSSGSFATFAPPGTTATFFAPWSFNSGPIPAFWTAGGFTFNLISSIMESQGFGPGGLGFVTAGGTGMISGNGFTPTSGTWSFSTQDPGTPGTGGLTFSFSAGTNALPEGGTTLALLGIALIGVELVRRKMTVA